MPGTRYTSREEVNQMVYGEGFWREKQSNPLVSFLERKGEEKMRKNQVNHKITEYDFYNHLWLIQFISHKNTVGLSKFCLFGFCLSDTSWTMGEN